MKLGLSLVLSGLFAIGCKPQEPPEVTAPSRTAKAESAAPGAPAPAAPSTTSQAPSGGGGTTVSQYTPTNLGGITPVQGAESVDGAGSAVGQVAKDRARSVQGKVSNGGMAPQDPNGSPSEGQ